MSVLNNYNQIHHFLENGEFLENHDFQQNNTNLVRKLFLIWYIDFCLKSKH